MKVGVYLGDLAPVVGGGFTFQEDILQALIETQDSERHSFVIYSNLKDGQLGVSRSQNLRFESTHNGKWRMALRWVNVCFDGLGFLGDSLHWKGWFERSLSKQAVELVWFVTPTYYLIDIPYIYTIWDLQHRLQPWFPEVSSHGRWQFREKSYQQVIARAAAILTPNPIGKEEVVRFYQVPPDRVRTVPHPTPSFALRSGSGGGQDVLQKYGIPPNFLLYPAQFWPHKNHINLLAAVRMLREKEGIFLPLVFVGADYGNLKHVKDTARLWGMEGQVYFLGFVPREDLLRLYRNALALTYVSFCGPENLPPLEAFALGCPVIASLYSGATEQLGNAALLVGPTDVGEIAAAIKSVYQNSELRQSLVSRGRERALKWTAADYVRELLGIFDEFEKVRRCWPASL
jgi:glycosyltransferase involved in cell wall biosynthesis